MGRAFEYRKAAKEKRWGKMSRVFPRLARAITMAAKEGGPDPDMNAKLRTAIVNAKAQNMPKNNIDAAIERASGKDAANFTEVNYEGRGPHGTMIFVECATDNNTRTVANIKMHFNKNGGEMLKTGSLEFMFDRKAIFEFAKSDDIDLEELELELIDAGLEELEVEDDTVYVYGEFGNFGALSQAFEDKKIDLKKASLQRIPNNTVELTEEQMAEVDKLIEAIEDDDDVQAVFTNIA